SSSKNSSRSRSWSTAFPDFNSCVNSFDSSSYCAINSARSSYSSHRPSPVVSSKTHAKLFAPFAAFVAFALLGIFYAQASQLFLPAFVEVFDLALLANSDLVLFRQVSNPFQIQFDSADVAAFNRVKQCLVNK